MSQPARSMPRRGPCDPCRWRRVGLRQGRCPARRRSAAGDGSGGQAGERRTHSLLADASLVQLQERPSRYVKHPRWRRAFWEARGSARDGLARERSSKEGVTLAAVKRWFTSRAGATEPQADDASGFRLDIPSAPADDTLANTSNIARSRQRPGRRPDIRVFPAALSGRMHRPSPQGAATHRRTRRTCNLRCVYGG